MDPQLIPTHFLAFIGLKTGSKGRCHVKRLTPVLPLTFYCLRPWLIVKVFTAQ